MHGSARHSHLWPDVFYIGAFAIVFLALWGTFYAVLPALWVLIQRLTGGVALWVQRWRRGRSVVTYASRVRDYGPVALILILGAFGTMAVGDAFMDLGEMVQGHSPILTKLDTNVHDWVVTERSPGATRFFVVMTTIGGPVGVAIIVGIAAMALAIARRWRWLTYLVITAGGGALLNLELKRYFERARPALAEMLRRAQGYSFPSGHAMGSTVAFGALAYLAFRMTWQWRWKAAVLALACTIVISVAASRVYLGVHWMSDVGAGISAGTVWVFVTTLAYETFRRVRGVRQVRLAARAGAGTEGS